MIRRLSIGFYVYPILVFVITAVMAASSVPASGYRFDELMDEYAEAFEMALAKVDLEPEDVTFDLHDRDFYGGDKYRLRFFDTFIANPFKIRKFIPAIAESAFNNATDPALLLVVAQNRTSNSIRLGLVSDPLETYKKKLGQVSPQNYLADSISALFDFAGTGMSEGERTFLKQKSSAVPEKVAEATALFLYALPDIIVYRKYALLPVDQLIMKSKYGDMVETFVLSSGEGIHDEVLENDLAMATLTEGLMDNLDYNYLHTGGELLAFTVKEMLKILEGVDKDADFSFTFETPYGLIYLNGKQSHTYAAGMPYLLIIDTGGDDFYFGGAGNVSMQNPVSLLIDVSGNDTYRNEETSVATFGAGVFGYGFLVDLAGNDSYESPYVSQGAGIFGVGLLMDLAGDDHYKGVANVQASGTYGTGVLSDIQGNDTYECYQLSQGYGFTMGVGLLVDVSGDDKYIANDEDIRFPSAQTKDHNSSLAQGFGFGRRSDYLTGHSWAGGVGMLFDASGNDYYSSGVFGQGAGYWYGTGILLDKEGDDLYEGVWYVQGASAHFALGILEDLSGDDRYKAEINMAQGAGHDFSIGWLHDTEGDDTYEAPNLSLGGGNANGIGIFWDERGDDTYKTKGGTTLGKANPPRGGLRDFILCLGLFVDTGGNDSYPTEKAFAGNNKVWTQPAQRKGTIVPAAKGVGVDTAVFSMKTD